MVRQGYRRGEHKISIRAKVGRGTIYIPEYNPDCDECTCNPKLFASLDVIEFK